MSIQDLLFLNPEPLGFISRGGKANTETNQGEIRDLGNSTPYWMPNCHRLAVTKAETGWGRAQNLKARRAFKKLRVQLIHLTTKKREVQKVNDLQSHLARRP